MQMSGGHLLDSGLTESTPYILRSRMAFESRSLPAFLKFFSFSENYLFTNPKTSAIIFFVKAMASWCSRLARQPVTLEVDGSSPFEVAKK